MPRSWRTANAKFIAPALCRRDGVRNFLEARGNARRVMGSHVIILLILVSVVLDKECVVNQMPTLRQDDQTIACSTSRVHGCAVVENAA